MSNITKAYRVVRQEITSKKYLGGILTVSEVTKSDELYNELNIATSLPIKRIWLNGKEIEL